MTVNNVKCIGLQNLRRYFELIIFQSYLQSTEPDTMESFESVEIYVKNRPGIFFCSALPPLFSEFMIDSDQNFREGTFSRGNGRVKTFGTSGR